MKKILTILLVLLLCGCASSSKSYDSKLETNPDDRYLDMISLIKDNMITAKTKSEYFDVTFEMSEINDGYRYYCVIDNPRVAMYDVEAIAIEPDVNYRKVMAANIGVFDEKQYNMIPGQVNTDKGFVSGVSISGISEKPETTLYVLVQWKNKDLSQTYREYIKADLKAGQ